MTAGLRSEARKGKEATRHEGPHGTKRYPERSESRAEVSGEGKGEARRLQAGGKTAGERHPEGLHGPTGATTALKGIGSVEVKGVEPKATNPTTNQ